MGCWGVKGMCMPSKPPRYDSEQIDVLDSLTAIRKRPGMYIQGTDKAGIHQLVKEVVDNSLDEHLAGHCTRIEVALTASETAPAGVYDTVSVLDDGRGIPAGIHRKTGFSTLTTVFVKTHSGGKFDQQAYTVSAGLHGVGITATNALSEWLEVKTKRPEGMWEQRFDRGAYKKDARKVRKSKDPIPTDTGTWVCFKPDHEIFTKVRVDPKVVRDWLEATSYLCPGLLLILRVGDEKPEAFQKKGGVKQLLLDRLKKQELEPTHKPLVISTPEMDAALVWVRGEKSDGEAWWCYTNLSPTPEGGTPVTGSKRAIGKVVQNLATKEALVTTDIREGLRAVLSLRVREPLFRGQTKNSLQNPEWDKIASEIVYEAATTFFNKNPSVADTLIQRAVALRKAREAFKKQKKAIKAVKTAKRSARGILPKLAEAPFCDVEDRELVLVEGDSASGTAKLARDNSFQEILPLRGKVINAVRTNLPRLMSNEEIKSMLIATGLNIQPDPGDPKGYVNVTNNVRVGKVILLMDPDPDGKHIAALVLSFLAMWCWELIQQGKVYVVDPPLFVATYKDQRWFAATLQELKKVAKVPLERCAVSRLKGWGEASPAELWECALNPATRKLFQILPMNEEDTQDVKALMGNDTTTRKRILGIESLEPQVPKPLPPKPKPPKSKTKPKPVTKPRRKTTKPSKKPTSTPARVIIID
jgi:DNA gyrase subunit B